MRRDHSRLRQPLAAGFPDGVLHRLLRDVEARRAVALITNLATGARSLAHSPGHLGQDLAPALYEAFRCDKSMKLAGTDGELFINVFNPTPRLIVVGAVHIAQQLVPMARALGHELTTRAQPLPRKSAATRLTSGWPDEALPRSAWIPHCSDRAHP